MRKIILLIIVSLVVGVSVYLFLGILHKKSELEDSTHIKQNIHWFSDYISQNESINLKANMPVVLIFFNPGCDYCQHEAKTFQEQKESLAGIQWYWISDANPIEVHQFSEEYYLHQVPDLYFIKDSMEFLSEKAGISTIPQILVYNDSGKLVKEFKGETKIEAILETVLLQR